MTQRSPEYWKSRTYDVFYYGYLFFTCLLHFQKPRMLMKSNYGIDYGGSALASKYGFQEVVGQHKFAPTGFIPVDLDMAGKRKIITNFAQKHGYPVVLKPDNGFVGKGIFKIKSAKDIKRSEAALGVDYMIQDFVPGDIEFGLFYARYKGKITVPSINQKTFPTVIGDGVSTIQQLAEKNERYSGYWSSFLKEMDTSAVPTKGEKKVLSFVGSNTLGSKFTEDTHLVTDKILDRLHELFDDAPGFNFGRLDVKAISIEAFQNGDFIVIETNGMMSLPTNMLDPDSSFWHAVKVWHRHAVLLVRIAREHRQQSTKTMPLLTFAIKSKQLIDQVERQQDFVQ